MITLSKHFFISLLTAINLSKKKGLKFFFEVFVIRFFYAFDLIRSSLSSSNYNKSDILSKNFFIKDISANKILKDLNSMGYNNSLVVKDSYIDSIKNEILLKNSTLSFKVKKNLKNLKIVLMILII